VASNPFITDVPTPPDELIDRDDEWRALIDLADGGHSARLSAPRRYGKTTLLKKVILEADRIGMATVYVDLFGVVSAGEIALRIEDAYSASLKGSIGRWFVGVRRKWRPTASVTTPVGEVGIESAREDDSMRILHELLELPVRVHERSGKRSLVIFDEFQDLLAAGDQLDGVIRSHIQHHGPAASYIFAGSHPGLMSELFSTKKRPLFDQARPVELGPLPDDALADYIGSTFEESGGRDVGPSLDLLLNLVRGHPQRAMLMAHHLWKATPARGAADEHRWAMAFASVLTELQESFERMWDDFSANQRRVLASIAWIGPWGAGTSLYANETLERFRISKGTARDVLKGLRRRGDVEPVGRSYRLVDPLFEAWIAHGRRPPSGDESDQT
jgi:hypothetical protein